MHKSHLKITNAGLTPWSGANCQQTLSPINTGNLLRTVNGKLIYIANPGQEKYQSVITSTDQLPPAFDNLWRGQTVQIQCIAELWQQLTGSIGNLARPHVPDSVQVTNAQGQPQDFTINADGKFECAAGQGFISYRPVLNMLITEISQVTNEWDFVSKWCLKSEEE